MAKTITWQCTECKTYRTIDFVPGTPLICSSCFKKWGKCPPLEKVFESCPICQASQFYLQKDFSQLLGCLILLAGILLVPKTYGLSLPVFAGIDWLVYRRVQTMAICYRCGTEFRGFDFPKHVKPFLHHIGAKYDKYR